MDEADEAQSIEALEREAAIRRVVQRHREPQVVRGGRVCCPDCGEEIPAARLAAVPDAVRCVDCQRDRES